jgi:hypothetical protein
VCLDRILSHFSPLGPHYRRSRLNVDCAVRQLIVPATRTTPSEVYKRLVFYITFALGTDIQDRWRVEAMSVAT